MSSETSSILEPGTPTCLFGAGGHGRVVAAQIKRRYRLPLCLGDEHLSLGDSVDGIEVRFRSVENVADFWLIITIGDNAIRRQLQEAAEAAGCRVTRVVIDSKRYFAEPPGAGCQVLAGAVVNTGAKIGAGVIINSGAVAEHDSIISEYSHLSPGSVVGGGASIGRGVLLGSNATVLPGISVAPGCVIGAGAVVSEDIHEAGIYVGVPARLIKKAGG